MRDPYEVLGLHPGASQAEVQDAYDKLSQVYNDQLQNDANMRRFVQEKRLEIREAYQFLMGGSAAGRNTYTTSAENVGKQTADGRTYYDTGRAQDNYGRADSGWQTAGGNPYNNPFGGGNSGYQQQPYRSDSPFVQSSGCGPCAPNYCCQLCAAQLCFECCCDSACGC